MGTCRYMESKCHIISSIICYVLRTFIYHKICICYQCILPVWEISSVLFFVIYLNIFFKVALMDCPSASEITSKGTGKSHTANVIMPWWRHQMETFSALLAFCAGSSPVPGEFPTQRPVTRSFDVFFDLRPNKRLGKQWWGWWFETPSCPLWRQCNAEVRFGKTIGTKTTTKRNKSDVHA